MTVSHPKFSALVLAADRGPDDPVARAAGVPCKSLTPIGSIPMIFRVVDALNASSEIGAVNLCGPPESIVNQVGALKNLITSDRVEWFPNQATPSTSAYYVLQRLPLESPVLLTTADHALLNTRITDHFCRHARKSGCDIVIGIARHDIVRKAYPQTRRTATKFADGAYCGCNLFAFLTPRARTAADFWRQVEAQRKSPLRVINALGWTAVIRFLLGRLTLADALKRISSRLGFKAGAVILPFAEAAIDVDTIDDRELVEKIVAQENPR